MPPPSGEAPKRKPPTRRLRASARKMHLLNVGVALVRERGWQNLTIADVARRAGVTRQLVHQYFGDLESLALELAERFEEEAHTAAVEAIARHPDDLAAAMRETLQGFIVDLRDRRLAYIDLMTGHWYHPRLRGPLKQVRTRKRRRTVDVWARYYERVYGFSRRDAESVSSFQGEGVRGLVAQVDAGRLSADEAITLFIEILEAIIERVGGRTQPNRRPSRARG